jgi:hypothetical protein
MAARIGISHRRASLTGQNRKVWDLSGAFLVAEPVHPCSRPTRKFFNLPLSQACRVDVLSDLAAPESRDSEMHSILPDFDDPPGWLEAFFDVDVPALDRARNLHQGSWFLQRRAISGFTFSRRKEGGELLREQIAQQLQ